MLRVASWNVNSVRSRLEAVERWLDGASPDVLLLQETKVEDGRFPMEAFESRGYRLELSGQKALNGVAIASRAPLTDVRRGLSSGFLADQKRLISCRCAGLWIVDAYVPNGGDPSLDRFLHKLEFMEQLLSDCLEMARSGQVLVCGDFNVAPGPEDVYDPEALDGTIGYHPEERSRMRSFLDSGFVDLLRRFLPHGRAYSWWDYRSRGFERDRGMRLDHMLATEGLAGQCRSFMIDRDVRGWDRPSDHAPLMADFDIPTV